MTNAKLRATADHFREKLQNIKVALFDLDGILTDGRVFFSSEEVGFNRFFNVRDGYGMKVLMESGIKVGIITGGNSLSVTKRFRENLPVDYVFMGNEDKREAYKEILKLGFNDSEILYMGDEFFDLPLLKRAGFSATVPNSSLEIQESVDYVTLTTAGMGAAREVIDLVRYCQNIVPEINQF